MANDLREAIIATSRSLGISPLDLATAISYETAGTFDPLKRGPTTQHGQHRGLIQFGEPQAQKYGVDWENPVGSQLGEDGAVAKYLRDTGVKPGMGLLDIYSAINAGGVGRYNRSDANNGGAPGTVRDKVETQMVGHRRNAERLLGEIASVDTAAQDIPAPSPAPVFGGMAPTQAASAPPPPVPESVRQAANPAPTGNNLSDVFGMLAMAGNQGPQFAPAQIMGPSPEQATGLSQLVQALRSRII